MTRDELLKKSWRGYQILIYKPPRWEECVQVMLIAINFDDELLTVMPINKEIYNQDDWIVNAEHCSIPPKEMQVILEKNKLK